MSPCIIATARSGSSYISYLMYKIGKDQYKFKNYLNEYFTISKKFISDYEVVNSIVERKYKIRVNEQWFENSRMIRLERLKLLQGKGVYAFKFFAEDIEPEINEYIIQNHQPIFLERKDKISQFISYSHMITTNVGSYYHGENKIIDQIVIDPSHLPHFLEHQKVYRNYKRNFKGSYKTLYYEDFMDSVDKIDFVKNLIEVNEFDANHIDVGSIKTPYINRDVEALITNKYVWEKIKFKLQKEFSIEKL